MGDAQRKELNAFFSFFATFDLARPVTTVADLSDGAALLEVLSVVYAPFILLSLCCSLNLRFLEMQSTSVSQRGRPRNYQITGSFDSAS